MVSFGVCEPQSSGKRYERGAVEVQVMISRAGMKEKVMEVEVALRVRVTEWGEGIKVLISSGLYWALFRALK